MIGEWLRLNHPQKASELIQRAGVQLSLAARAVADGTSPMTAEVWSELQQVDPGWVDSQRKAADARMLAGLEEQADKFIAASRKQRETLTRNGPNTATAQHCNEWNRRHQGMGNLPARRLIGR